jgi:small subunit ribosomal protein S20
MPIKKSAKKALRQSFKRRARNLTYKRKIKKLTKEIRKLISQKKIKEAKSLLPQIYKFLDKAIKIGVVKKNTAARKKSRITKFIAKSQG